jgi:predicted extracellular nuclease
MSTVLFLACLTPQSTEGGEDSGEDENSGPLTVADLRGGAYGDGDAVELTGVVVTSPLTRDGNGFFVQDAEGGPRSGLYVWTQMGFTEPPASQGDVVTISGSLSEYYDWTELVVSDESAVTVTGQADVPAAADLGDGAGVAWDDYESMLVTLTDQTVVSVDEYSTGTLSAGIAYDDGFQYNDFDCRGSYVSLTGIIFYNYGAWSLNNRSDADKGAYSGAETLDATVREIQEDGVCGPIRLSGVVATTPNADYEDSSTFFVQDEGGGGYTGVAIYTANESVSVSTGDVLTLEGEVSEYKGMTEIYVGDASTLSADGSATPVATTIQEAPADWEPYEGVLLTLTGVEAETDQEYGAVLTNYGIYVDNLYYDFEGGAGTTWTSVTGALYYTTYDDIGGWYLEPRSEADLVE